MNPRPQSHDVASLCPRLEADPRRPYAPPRLQVLGSIEQLTLSGSGNNADGREPAPST